MLAAAELVAPVRPTRVGIDETVMTTGKLTTCRRQFLTALVCLGSSLVVACDLFSWFKSAADAPSAPHGAAHARPHPAWEQGRTLTGPA